MGSPGRLGAALQESSRTRQKACGLEGCKSAAGDQSKDDEGHTTYYQIFGAEMSGPLIILVGFIYAYVAVDQYLSGNSGLAIAYTGYAFSNIGLWMIAK
jgi:uncharacterized membrane protein